MAFWTLTPSHEIQEICTMFDMESLPLTAGHAHAILCSQSPALTAKTMPQQPRMRAGLFDIDRDLTRPLVQRHYF